MRKKNYRQSRVKEREWVRDSEEERLMPKNRNQSQRRNGNTGRSERRSRKEAKQKSDRSDNRKTVIQTIQHLNIMCGGS